MRLTDHTDYCLRVLIYLNRSKTLVTLTELSAKLGISRNNLIKVSNQLSKLGFISTTRGPNGGIRINEGAGKTKLSEVIGKTEESFNIAECFSGKKINCTFLNNCMLRKQLKSALDSFLSTLGESTLDDVTPKGRS